MKVPPPPTSQQRLAELKLVHALSDARTPALDARANELNERGGWSIWQDEARAWHADVSRLRGIVGTLRMDAAIGAALLRTSAEKHRHQLERPFQLDPTIELLGGTPHGSSYPSGHATAAAAAATVLSHLDPDRRSHYEQLADEVRWARVYSGVHFPTDTQAGAAIGRAAGLTFAGGGRARRGDAE